MRKKWRIIIFILVLLPFLFFVETRFYEKKHFNLVRYVTRPLWDKMPSTETPSFTKIFPNKGGYISQESCAINGLKLREFPVRVFDFFMFNNELDLLEIRLNELKDVVDTFVLVESTWTFTNMPKIAVYNQTKDRFKQFHDKIIHLLVQTQDNRNVIPMERERKLRAKMWDGLFMLGAREGDLLIVADTDEIPRSEVIKLFKYCEGFPQRQQLQMRNYMFSFEFQMRDTNNVPSLRVINGSDLNNLFSHRRVGDMLVADAGWHCSYCLKYVEDIIEKMEAYSHADQATKDSKNKLHLQRVMCTGGRIFPNYYPEVYSFRDLILSWADLPSTHSVVGLPAYLVENFEKFKYLFPGHCKREPKLL